MRPVKRPKVSLVMIARDEEQNLPRCLASVRGLFDEIVIVDTGSVDRTVEIARDFGARVFDFAWVDDFAAARNAALDHATGEYAFTLDADDVVDAPEREKLRTLLDRFHEAPQMPAYWGCRMRLDYPGGEQVTLPGHQVKLFPIGADIRWEYRVHETVHLALRRAGIPGWSTPIVIRHTGYADPAHVASGRARDRRLISLMLHERPDDLYVRVLAGQAPRHPDLGLAHMETVYTQTSQADKIA